MPTEPGLVSSKAAGEPSKASQAVETKAKARLHRKGGVLKRKSCVMTMPEVVPATTTGIARPEEHISDMKVVDAPSLPESFRSTFLKVKDSLWRRAAANLQEMAGGGNQGGWRPTNWLAALPAWRLGAVSLIVWIGYGNGSEALAMVAASIEAGRQMHVLAYACEELTELCLLTVVVPLLVRLNLLPQPITLKLEGGLTVLRFGSCSMCLAHGPGADATVQFRVHVLTLVQQYVSACELCVWQPTHVYTAGDSGAGAFVYAHALLWAKVSLQDVVVVCVGHQQGTKHSESVCDAIDKANGYTSRVLLEGKGGSKPIRVYYFNGQEIWERTK
jgi:hypothetical protein